jgi:16S rRNA processing protein RimM
LYVNSDQIRRKKKSPGNLPDFTGYIVTDNKLGFIGIAGSIEDISNNPLLHVNHEGRNFMIPLHEDIIESIDDEEQSIIINAPEGLFDL